MIRAIAVARRIEAQSLAALRMAIVSGCAIALIVADRALPV
jgi:hypothetical protein